MINSIMSMGKHIIVGGGTGASNYVNTTVGLTGQAEAAIDWAHKKMEEEREARAMAEQYPAVADALNAVWESEQQLKTVVALCRV